MRFKIKPEYFDILGIIVFPLLFVFAVFELHTNILPNHVVLVLIMLTGIIGTVIDASIVYHFIIKKDKKI